MRITGLRKRRFTRAFSKWVMPVVLVACVGSATGDAQARAQGIMEQTCDGCHGSASAELSVAFEPALPAAGSDVTLTVTVGGNNLKAAGIAVKGPADGTWIIDSGTGLKTSDGWVTHSEPKAATGGQVQFQFAWRSPATPGVGDFSVAVIAANLDGRQSGDRTGWELVQIPYGCEPVTLYVDIDRDGVGTSEFSPVLGCEVTPGYSLENGDCDDFDGSIYPGATELCNQQDDDCDGDIDEGVMDVPYYLDADHDGYGDPAISLVACIPPDGYVTNASDCHDGDATAHPQAVEICDFVDNNCDGLIDEGAHAECGVGQCYRQSSICGVTCVPGEPTVEVCNGLDDDCDGEVDEGFCAAGEVCQDAGCAPAPISTAPTPSSTAPLGPDAGGVSSAAVSSDTATDPPPTMPADAGTSIGGSASSSVVASDPSATEPSPSSPSFTESLESGAATERDAGGSEGRDTLDPAVADEPPTSASQGTSGCATSGSSQPMSWASLCAAGLVLALWRRRRCPRVQA